MLRRQLGWLQESGIELTIEHFQLDHFCRTSVKPRRYGRKNCPSPTTTYGILGLPLEITSVSSSVIKEWFSMISNFFLILRFYDSALEKERGRFQSLARADAQIHLVCEIDKRSLPTKIYTHHFAWRSVSSLPSLCSLLQWWFFLWKEIKNPNKTGLSNKDISSCIEQLLNVYFGSTVTLGAIKKSTLRELNSSWVNKQ